MPNFNNWIEIEDVEGIYYNINLRHVEYIGERADTDNMNLKMSGKYVICISREEYVKIRKEISDGDIVSRA